MDTIARTVARLSGCASTEDIASVVRTAARSYVGADGITFVVREGRMVRYLDEDAISPLWKGMSLPIAQCVSGLAMLGRETIVIPDIFADPRVPHEFYATTFVKSMAMSPVRPAEPIAAIGAYWATRREPSAAQVAQLDAMAAAASDAMAGIAARGPH